MKQLALILATFLILRQASAQRLVDLSTHHVCGWSKTFDQKSIWVFDVDDDDSVKILVREICEREVLDYNTFGVAVSPVDNIIATIDEGQRYIYYSKAFFATLNNRWYKLAILAHEIGHHVNNNVVGTGDLKRPADELAADRFAGKVLCEFGAPYSIIKGLLDETCSEKGSPFYPDRPSRQEAMLIGYEKGGCRLTAIPAPIPQTLPVIRTPIGNTPRSITAFSLKKTLLHSGPLGSLSFNDPHSLFPVYSQLPLQTEVPQALNYRILIINALTGTIEKSFPGDMFGFAISNTDRVLVAAADTTDKLNVYDYKSGKILHQLTAERFVEEVKFSPDDNVLAFMSDNHIMLWYLRTMKVDTIQVDAQHTGRIIKFSPDGRLLGFVKDDDILLYSLETHRIIKKIQANVQLDDIAFVPGNEEILCTGYDDSIRVFSQKDGSFIRGIKVLLSKNEQMEMDRRLGGKNIIPQLFALAITSDGNYIAISGSFGFGMIKIYASDGKLVQTIQAHTADIESILFNADNTLMVSYAQSNFNPIRIWHNGIPDAPRTGLKK